MFRLIGSINAHLRKQTVKINLQHYSLNKEIDCF